MNAKPVLLLSLTCLSCVADAQVVQQRQPPLAPHKIAGQSRLELRGHKENGTTRYQLEVVDKNLEEIFNKLGNAQDLQIVAVGDLSAFRIPRLSVRASSIEELLLSVVRVSGVNMMIDAQGIHYFARNINDFASIVKATSAAKENTQNKPLLELFLFKEEGSTSYRLEVSDKNVKEILEKLATSLGIQVVTYGDLSAIRVSKLSISASSVGELLEKLVRSTRLSLLTDANGIYHFGIPIIGTQPSSPRLDPKFSSPKGHGQPDPDFVHPRRVPSQSDPDFHLPRQPYETDPDFVHPRRPDQKSKPELPKNEVPYSGPGIHLLPLPLVPLPRPTN
jgi:hypothetical protein